jgi:hypothetical protein
MATLEKVNQSLKDQERSDKKGFEGTISAVESLNNTMQSFVKMVQLQNMKLLEAMREKQAAGAAASEDVKAEEPKNNLKMILLGIVALLGGFLKGLADSLKVYAKLFRLDKLMELIKTNLSTLRANISAGLQRILTPIRAFFSAKGAQLAAIADDFKMKTLTLIDDAKAGIQRAIQPIRNFFASSGESSLGRVIRNVVTFIRNAFMFPLEPLADLVKPFKAIFTGGDDGVSIITKIVNTIKAPFTAAIEAAQKAGGSIKSAFAIFSEGSQFMKILGTIGRVIGRIFLPLTLIMTAYDTIKGAIQGFEEDGFLGGLAGAIKGLLQSVIGMPLDLLKSAVSWILGKFGLDDAEKFLDSFSFSELIGKMINGLVNSVIEGAAVIADAFGLGDKIRKFKIGDEGKETKEKIEAVNRERASRKVDSTPPPVKEEAQSKKAEDVITPTKEFPQESLFAKRARLRKEAREKRFAERVEARRNKEAEELDAMGGAGGAVKTQNVVNAPTSSVQNNNTANNQTIVSPPTTSHDGGDPRYTDPMPWD